jgi:hypothetical protein
MDCIKKYLAKHPLFGKIMKGMPLAISILASQTMGHSLKEIYQKNYEASFII